VRCAGAPRDLGLDQGQACGARVREQLREQTPLATRLAAWLPGGRSRRIWRDVECYFPHQAERTLGLSSGVRVPARTLMAPLARLLEGDGAGLGVGVAGEGRALLVRSCRAPGAWLVRHSAPDNDYRSVELTQAWSVAATIGVNEHGLAAMVTALPRTTAALEGCAAPAALLVQDVLQRFDSVDKAMEWALRRPAGGEASVLFADSTGALGGVHVEGRTRRVLEPEEGLLFGLAPPAQRMSLEKAAAGVLRLDGEGLARSLASMGPATVAVADPAGRRLGVVHPSGVIWHPVTESA
jgi:hypothetical protein